MFHFIHSGIVNISLTMKRLSLIISHTKDTISHLIIQYMFMSYII